VSEAEFGVKTNVRVSFSALTFRSKSCPRKGMSTSLNSFGKTTSMSSHSRARSFSPFPSMRRFLAFLTLSLTVLDHLRLDLAQGCCQPLDVSASDVGDVGEDKLLFCEGIVD